MADQHITIPRARLRALEDAEDALEAASRILGERAQAMQEVVAERDKARAQVAALQAENAALRRAAVIARDGYISERTTGLPVAVLWRERTLSMLDAAIDAARGAKGAAR